MITTLIAMTLIGMGQQKKVTFTCPVTHEEIDQPFAVFNYKGAKYEMCCGMCPGPFSKDPEKYLDPTKLKDMTVAVSYFDPVSGMAVNTEGKAPAGPSTYNSVAYYFESADDQKTFDADPKKYTEVPAKEEIYCPVMKQEVPDLAHSGGYADVNGVRYYICCGQCAAMLKADPSKYLDADAAARVHDVVAVQIKKSK
jgi:YHS domain-containing protein